jgi:hypothetical protein
MPPAFARGFPAHFQGRFGSNLMGPGATRPLERNMQTRPSRTGRGHFFLCTWNAKKSSARGEPKKLPLDTATCAHDAWVTCNILRNNVPNWFSFLPDRPELEIELRLDRRAAAGWLQDWTRISTRPWQMLLQPRRAGRTVTSPTGSREATNGPNQTVRRNRDRGKPRGFAPPTPPYKRVRIRRFVGLSYLPADSLGIPNESK